jgi:hypothetical protein
MKTSPGSESRPITSTWTSSSKPTERVMMFLYRECFASSGVIIPALICSLTRLWSSLICWMRSPRTRYARLSPTWAKKA